MKHVVAEPLAAGLVAPAGTALAGYTIHETAGAAATVLVYDNAAAASGTLLLAVELAADGSATVLGASAVRAAAGVFVDITGTVDGSLFIA